MGSPIAIDQARLVLATTAAVLLSTAATVLTMPVATAVALLCAEGGLGSAAGAAARGAVGVLSMPLLLLLFEGAAASVGVAVVPLLLLSGCVCQVCGREQKK